MRLKLSPNPLRSIYAIWFMGWTLLVFLLLYPFMRLFLLSPKTYFQAHLVRRIWCNISLFLGLVQVEVIGGKTIDPQRSYILTSNHTSWLDGVILTARFPVYFNFLVMEELARIPLFGIWFRTLDLAIDRKHSGSAAFGYRKALQWLSEGRSMVVFPEGVVSSQVPQLIAFKDGPFRMAIEKQIPIIPATFIGSWEILPDRGYLEGKPGKVKLFLHDPIETTGMRLEDTSALRDRVFQIINTKLHDHGYQ